MKFNILSSCRKCHILLIITTLRVLNIHLHRTRQIYSDQNDNGLNNKIRKQF